MGQLVLQVHDRVSSVIDTRPFCRFRIDSRPREPLTTFFFPSSYSAGCASRKNTYEARAKTIELVFLGISRVAGDTNATVIKTDGMLRDARLTTRQQSISAGSYELKVFLCELYLLN